MCWRWTPGTPLPDRIPRTRAADLAWLPDGTGFYYTRYPAAGEVPEGEEHYHRAVFFHRLGSRPDGDPLVFRPAEKEHWPGVGLSPDGRWLVIGVARTFDQTDLYLQDLPAGTPPVPVAQDLPASFDGEVVHGRLFLRTNLDAPTYRLYRGRSGAARRESAGGRSFRREPTPCSRVLRIAGDRLALSYLERASRASAWPISRADGAAGRGPAHARQSLFGLAGEWDGQRAVLRLLLLHRAPDRVPARSRRPAAARSGAGWRPTWIPSRFEVRQVAYPSKDGTAVTMFLVHRPGLARDGDNPVYLTGYGGFNISMTPAFSRSLLLWLERGGVVAMPNIRGGGEYGEAWHQAGMLGQKQNIFDDFIAAAEWLIGSGTPSPSGSPRPGGSNGGLLMGAALTQRPELFRRRADPGAAARHAALPPVPHRPAVDPGVRLGRGPGAVPLAPRLLALSPRARRGGLSGGAARDRGERHPGRSAARPQDGRPAAGGDLVRTGRSCSAWKRRPAMAPASRSPRCWTS